MVTRQPPASPDSCEANVPGLRRTEHFPKSPETPRRAVVGLALSPAQSWGQRGPGQPHVARTSASGPCGCCGHTTRSGALTTPTYSTRSSVRGEAGGGEARCRYPRGQCGPPGPKVNRSSGGFWEGALLPGLRAEPGRCWGKGKGVTVGPWGYSSVPVTSWWGWWPAEACEDQPKSRLAWAEEEFSGAWVWRGRVGGPRCGLLGSSACGVWTPGPRSEELERCFGVWAAAPVPTGRAGSAGAT